MRNNDNRHTIFNYSALLLIVILLSPTIISSIHLFEGHKQDTCNIKNSHIHEKELECSICDFNLNQNYSISLQDFNFNTISFKKSFIIELYNFKYYHQQLPYSLRGPPELLT